MMSMLRDMARPHQRSPSPELFPTRTFAKYTGKTAAEITAE
jgi:hypothetical protein